MQFFQKNQIITYYLLCIMVIGIIAARTNSFYSTAATTKTIIVLSLLFISLFVIRKKTEHFFVRRHELFSQTRRQFFYEMLTFIFVASILFLSEIMINQLSFIFASKLFSGVIIIGYFASMDSALNREYLNFIKLHRKPSRIKNTIPVVRRFSSFLTITLLVIIFTNTISAYSYMSLNLTELTLTVAELKNAYLIETFFTLGIVVSLTLRLIYSYSINLQFLFDTQVNALQHIQDGNLENYVPILSRDEFGVIAQQTNRVIDDLREKEKIRHTLESIVSPDIMNKLIQTDSSSLQHGEEKHIAVFFCDLRKFTTYAEKNTPEDVIFFLNTYFSKIVDIVTEHKGIVNKFMGDAILAVYPLDNKTATIDDAVETAWDIVNHSLAIRMPDGERFNVGIGIHMGFATAGTIGSLDRFEYTFIGDTVNIASRLDGLSKRLGYSIIISEATYQDLNSNNKEKFIDLGIQKIRGKETPLHVYGAATIQYIEH